MFSISSWGSHTKYMFVGICPFVIKYNGIILIRYYMVSYAKFMAP